VEENKRRSAQQKPLYVMFDQVYWMLTFGDSEFHHPLAVCPQLKPYAVFIDGISKAFAATGVRVGWATGPAEIMLRMRAFLAHIGAWAPKPEQVATGRFLAEKDSVATFLTAFRAQLQLRLQGFYDGFMGLKAQGFDVDAIAPQGSIYLSIRLSLKGKTTADGRVLETDAPYLLPRDMENKPKNRRNEPAFLPHIVNQVALWRGEDPQWLADITDANARKLFALPERR